MARKPQAKALNIPFLSWIISPFHTLLLLRIKHIRKHLVQFGLLQWSQILLNYFSCFIVSGKLMIYTSLIIYCDVRYSIEVFCEAWNETHNRSIFSKLFGYLRYNQHIIQLLTVGKKNYNCLYDPVCRVSFSAKKCKMIY